MWEERVRVLIVDDDEDDYVMIRDLIAEIPGSKLRLDWVPTFDLGQEACRADQYDLYMVDYRLGERSGLDFIRTALESGCRAPIILLTGYGDHEVDLEAMRIGAADYLVKTQLTAPLLERTVRYAVYRAHSLEELRQREQNFRDLFNSTFEGVVIHRSGEVIDVNEAALRIFGRRRGEMRGTQLGDVVDLSRSSTPLVRDGQERMYETTGSRLDGSSVSLEVSEKPYHYRGEIVRLTAIRDISARKHMEAQILLQDRLASIGLLASSLAHEIGTPLGVIRGRAEFLAIQAKENESVRKTADVIISQIDRVSKLIRSLLNLARGEQKGQAVPVELHAVVSEVAELMAHQLRKVSVAFENAVPDQVGIRVLAETGPLSQVILNLLVNSVHAIEGAMREGRGSGHRIRIHVEDHGDRLVLGVEDTGTGISPANMKNLFKPFFTTKDIGQGTGLGLVTSYRIVESWGGTITAESQLGIGTTFRIFLPKA